MIEFFDGGCKRFFGDVSEVRAFREIQVDPEVCDPEACVSHGISSLFRLR